MRTPKESIDTALQMLRERLEGEVSASGVLPLPTGGSIEYDNVLAIRGGVLPGIFKYRVQDVGGFRPRWRVLGLRG